MARESLYNPDRNVIFRETLNSEFDVIKNGGDPTDVVFSDGIGDFDGLTSKIEYPALILNGTYSILINFTTKNPVDAGMLIDFRAVIGTGYFTIAASEIRSSSGTLYLNGSLGISLQPDTKYQAVVSGITIASGGTAIVGTNGAGTGENNIFIDLIDIHKGTITAEEVSNLYNNIAYRDISSKDLILNIRAEGGIHDTIGNTLTLDSGVELKKDNVFSSYFNNTNDGINSGIIPNLTNVTINLWARLIPSPFTFETLVGNDVSFRLMISHSINTSYFVTPTLTNTIVFNRSVYLWNMYTMTINSSGKVIFYFNGINVGEVASGQTLINAIIFFGSYGTSTSGDRYMKGFQNQQRIYNRTATALEVSQLYTSQKHNYNS